MPDVITYGAVPRYVLYRRTSEVPQKRYRTLSGDPPHLRCHCNRPIPSASRGFFLQSVLFHLFSSFLTSDFRHSAFSTPRPPSPQPPSSPPPSYYRFQIDFLILYLHPSATVAHELPPLPIADTDRFDLDPPVWLSKLPPFRHKTLAVVRGFGIWDFSVWVAGNIPRRRGEFKDRSGPDCIVQDSVGNYMNYGLGTVLSAVIPSQPYSVRIWPSVQFDV